ncbi:MAG: beta-phosphoglucomutase [Bacteroidales bacterium]|jgi:beta-phosphoglucomutase|nr:beta-phosphoglucomutase [Bacteroidales bacterium]
MTMELRGCIFDLDGVIVDTAKYHFMAWRRLAKELGFEFTVEENEALKGVSRMTSLEILLKTGGVTVSEKDKEVLAARKNGWYVEFISGMTPDEILPGSVSLLKSLRKAGIMTAIGSASRNAGTILDRIALREMFDVIVDGNKIHKAKPDPEVFLRGAEEMNLPPSCCIVFEDAQAGIEAAIAGGMKSVGVGSPELLGRADLVIPNLKNITIRQLRNL